MNVDSTARSTEIHWNDQTTFLKIFSFCVYCTIYLSFTNLWTLYCVALHQEGKVMYRKEQDCNGSYVNWDPVVDHYVNINNAVAHQEE